MIAEPHSSLPVTVPSSTEKLGQHESNDSECRPTLDGGVHRLQDEWQFFYKTPKSKSKNYAKAINLAFAFNSIEAFWNYYSNIYPLPSNSKCEDYFVFKSSFKPEVEHIPQGCRHIIELYQYEKSFITEAWEKLILLLIGDFLGPDTDHVNGINLNPKSTSFRLNIWYNKASNHSINDRITQKLLNAINIIKPDIKVDSNEEARLRYAKDAHKFNRNSNNDDYQRQSSKNHRYEGKRSSNHNNYQDGYGNNSNYNNRRHNDRRGGGQNGGGSVSGGGGYNSHNNNSYRSSR